MEKILDRIAHLNGADAVPPEAKIWKGLRSKEFSRPIKYFLWMSTHDGYKVGPYWSKIPGFESRGECQKCGVTESMEHILTKCEELGQAEIWTLVKDAWKGKTGNEIEILFPDILCCGALKQRGETKEMGEMRYYRILISEAAHLIWKLRNERVIRDRKITTQEIQNRWKYSMSLRFDLDLAATARRYGKQAIQPQIVSATWCQTAEGTGNIPQDWMESSTGVLVGRGRQRHTPA